MVPEMMQSRYFGLGVCTAVLGLVLAMLPMPAHALMVEHYECRIIATGHTSGGGTSGTFPGWMECVAVSDYVPDSYYDGSGGGGGGGTTESYYCSMLKTSKPANCPEPVAPPLGAYFGQGEYAAASGLAKLIYLANSGYLLPNAKQIIDTALADHTAAIASITASNREATGDLLRALQTACQYEVDHALPGAFGISKCGEAYDRIYQENGVAGFWYWLKSWVETNDVNIGIAQVLIDSLAPDNSISAKYAKVTTQAQCSLWWEEMTKNSCGA